MAALKPNIEYIINYENLSGGLNISKPSYQLFQNESPEMKNLRYIDGRLCSREGQTECISSESGAGHAAYRFFWHDAIFAHIGESIVALRREAVGRSPETVEEETWTEEVLISGIPEIRGTFFVYDGNLYYKTRGAYIRISVSQSESDSQLTTQDSQLSFTAAAVTPYIPVILMNASPTDAAGDLYQPENRLSAEKTVWYNASVGVKDYHLPVIAHHVTKVIVDGVQMLTGWLYDPQTGIVHFNTAPPVTTPPTNNTVRITYYLENAAAKAAIDECRFAAVYGGTGALCVVLGGSESQPNAYFWSGNSDIAMEPGYFPIEQYQLAGDADDAITGFGRKQSELIVFSASSVGKAALGTAEINGRLSIDMPYQQINSKIGCGFPWSIELIENNLVWANRSGIWMLLDTSAANENCITSISRKVEGNPLRPGLCFDLMQCESDEVSSLDDGGRYWITAGGNAWIWQYDISSFSNPSWFFYSDIDSVAFALDGETIYELGETGKLSVLEESLNDYGEAIEKKYVFAETNFGGYGCSKTLNSVIFSLGANSPTDTEITYTGDYGSRTDPTNLQIVEDYEENRVPGTRPMSDTLPAIFRRRPMNRRIYHFTMELSNSNVDEDMQIICAQIFYTYNGLLR